MTLLFPSPASWDSWLLSNGAVSREAWLLVARKGTPGLTAAEAGDVALCHGWIDGHRRSHSATHFLQRYSPRRPGSPWSQVNVARVTALLSAGRVHPAGLAQIEAARSDGRWAAAYEPQRTATVPPALSSALATDPSAAAAFAALTRAAQYALFLPLLKAGTEATRATALRRALTQLHRTVTTA